MRLGWKQTQPNNSHVDAQTDISLPHALTAPLAMFPAWNFRTPSGQDDRGYCFELWATISGAQPKPALPHDRVLRSKCPARRRDPGSNSALPSSKKQVREHHPRHETASGACHSGPVFCRKSQIGCTIPAGSCRLAPLTLIRHLVPPKASADVHNVPGAQPALHQQRARNKTSMKELPLAPLKRGPVDPGSSRRRPITWDETGGLDVSRLGCACRFFSPLLAPLDANPSITSDRLRPGPPCSAPRTNEC
ncbi:hypothetical protein M441DRAFT_42104 [Trichoderma asperellum CBS 433.97]|uniref:Uncharacterized protein n=1 Tax=Trichoderma asperellum (strain ATCC 204424 / CBS 433.97 / NBRC 101777) TaxID=1042311 RepID=A0A2T3ZNA3_TRIA4|nr:hypothetical protein M441DRAFT_42104 [Trichoderma asperellum CBS 433.97]PTB46279.1 hypothetical protein M441DRAFT_42104 [Trichoderma asperellum CBS 433.97]